mmetsp:Transcript_34716/g.30544  ORF Transcript_34716/g.30544 Transcript_34716/m.30544 type:complete len:503 (-) Transcript_34716:237-1745(-)
MEVISLLSDDESEHDDNNNMNNPINPRIMDITSCDDEETVYWTEIEHKQKSESSLPSLISNPMKINKNEFAIVTKCNGICKYNASINKWYIKWIPYPKEIKKLYNPNIACFDHINNLIYVYDSSYGRLLKVDLCTKQIEIIDVKIRLRFPRLIFTNFNKNPQLHLIGGAENNYHFIYNINGDEDNNLDIEWNNEGNNHNDEDYDSYDDEEDDDLDMNNSGLFRKHYKFDYEDGFAGFGVFYIHKYGQKEVASHSYSSSAPNPSTTNEPMLVIIGGIKWNASEFSDVLWKYDETTQIRNNNKMKYISKWNEIPTGSIPNGGMSRFGYTITRNQQYIILLGGFCDFEEIDDIYFIDTITWKLRESKIKCPKMSKDFHAITMINDSNDELIIFGYVRWLYYRSKHKHEFQSVLFPPVYIIKFIMNWYYNEWIYLIEFNQDPITQWRIHTDMIINNFVDDIDNVKHVDEIDNNDDKANNDTSSKKDIDNDNETNEAVANRFVITPL